MENSESQRTLVKRLTKHIAPNNMTLEEILRQAATNDDPQYKRAKEQKNEILDGIEAHIAKWGLELQSVKSKASKNTGNVFYIKLQIVKV